MLCCRCVMRGWLRAWLLRVAAGVVVAGATVVVGAAGVEGRCAWGVGRGALVRGWRCGGGVEAGGGGVLHAAWRGCGGGEGEGRGRGQGRVVDALVNLLQALGLTPKLSRAYQGHP